MWNGIVLPLKPAYSYALQFIDAQQTSWESWSAADIAYFLNLNDKANAAIRKVYLLWVLDTDKYI